jgi:hypothetical protein
VLKEPAVRTALVVAFAVPLIAAFNAMQPSPKSESMEVLRTRKVNYGKVRTGKERLLILIGSSSCGASSDPLLPSAIARIQSIEAAQAKREGKQFSTIGVATDWNLNMGVEFLNKVGVFDEISVGRSWGNAASVSLIWRDQPGPPTIPQLVIVERQVTVSPSTITYGTDSVIARKIGLDEIKRYSAKLEGTK